MSACGGQEGVGEGPEGQGETPVGTPAVPVGSSVGTHTSKDQAVRVQYMPLLHFHRRPRRTSLRVSSTIIRKEVPSSFEGCWNADLRGLPPGLHPMLGPQRQ